MKKCDEIILNILKKRVGEYASAKKLHEIFNLSLAFVYLITKNEKIKTRNRYGRKEYEISSFVETFEFKNNYNLISKPLSKEEFDINNYFNWSAKNEIESFLENLLLDELGEFTAVKNLVNFFGICKTSWYQIMEEGKIMYFNIEGRKVVITRSLLPFLREALQEKI